MKARVPMGSRGEEDPNKRRKERKSLTTFTRQNNPEEENKNSEEREALVRILSHSHLGLLLFSPPGAPTVAASLSGEERSGRPSGPLVPFPPSLR